MARLHIVLVPGFFGFVNFGELAYFVHIADFLRRRFDEAGGDTHVSSVKLPPTASLRARSALLAAHIAEVSREGDRVALIGHSSGGLDARLVVAPAVDLECDFELEPIARRVEAIVTVASPHLGTPLAELFTGLLGQKTLRLLSLVTVFILTYGKLPVGVLAKIGATLARLRLPGGKTEALLDHLHEELIGHLSGGQRDEIGTFFSQVGDDQSLLPQIAPAVADLLNASAARREGVRYGSLVISAPKPSLREQLALPKRIEIQAGYVLYRWLARSTTTASMATPELNAENRAMLRAAFGRVPDFSFTDGIVPTVSQIHGQVIWAGWADHLDIIGHFHGPHLEPTHTDWLMTGAGFGGEEFEAAWSAVASFVAGDTSVPTEPPELG